MATEKDDKLSGADLAGLIIIVLILMYFPYQWITEHAKDVAAMSYYHDGK